MRIVNMYIRRFNEAEQTISNQRLDEMIVDLENIYTSFEDDLRKIESYLNELSNHRSVQTKGLNQIDESVSNLEIIRSNLTESLTNLSNVLDNLDDYKSNGEESTEYIF